MKKYAIILAGGEGRRMGGSVPKQFLDLCGKPVLRHTIERFLEYDPSMRIIVVIPSVHKEYWQRYCDETLFIESYIMPSGGMTRFHSVQNGLAYVPDGALVAVHDGVRPLITPEFIGSLFDEASRSGAAIPVLPPVESLRRKLPDGSSEAVDRSLYVAVQTPQVFRSEILKAAYSQPYSTSFTDDASVAEACGQKISLCEGRRENIKITTPEDLAFARVLMSNPR